MISIKNLQKASLAKTRAFILDDSMALSEPIPVDPSEYVNIRKKLSPGTLRYIDLYPEDFTQTNEDEFVNTIHIDHTLTDDEKIGLAEILGNAEYLKENMETVSTQATENDCLETWKTATKAATTKYLVTGAWFVLTGDNLKLASAVMIAWKEIDIALENYNNCMKTATH